MRAAPSTWRSHKASPTRGKSSLKGPPGEEAAETESSVKSQLSLHCRRQTLCLPLSSDWEILEGDLLLRAKSQYFSEGKKGGR